MASTKCRHRLPKGNVSNDEIKKFSWKQHSLKWMQPSVTTLSLWSRALHFSDNVFPLSADDSRNCTNVKQLINGALGTSASHARRKQQTFKPGRIGRRKVWPKVDRDTLYRRNVRCKDILQFLLTKCIYTERSNKYLCCSYLTHVCSMLNIRFWRTTEVWPKTNPTAAIKSDKNSRPITNDYFIAILLLFYITSSLFYYYFVLFYCYFVLFYCYFVLFYCYFVLFYCYFVLFYCYFITILYYCIAILSLLYYYLLVPERLRVLKCESFFLSVVTQIST